MDSNQLLTIVLFIVGGLLTGGFVYLTSRDGNAAIVAALNKLLGDKAGLDAIEAMLADLDPEARAALLSVLDWFGGIAAGTPTEIDDKLVELLKKISDGLPNVRAGVLPYRFPRGTFTK